MIKVGSQWRGSDFSLFVVEKVEDGWVHYSKSDKYGSPTDKKYSCLQEAFEHRFSSIVT